MYLSSNTYAKSFASFLFFYILQIQYADLGEFKKSRPKPAPPMEKVLYAEISPATHEQPYINLGDQKQKCITNMFW